MAKRIKVLFILFIMSYHFIYTTSDFLSGTRRQRKQRVDKKGLQQAGLLKDDPPIINVNGRREDGPIKVDVLWKKGPTDKNINNKFSTHNIGSRKDSKFSQDYLTITNLSRKSSHHNKHLSKVPSEETSKTVSLSLPDHLYSDQKCVQKCSVPSCEVQCIGRQGSAVCNAESCKASARGSDSASLCTGHLCHAMCFKDKCISACEGLDCVGTCHGNRCHAVSHGPSSQTTCRQDGCMSYASGADGDAKCTGRSCQAQCVGENCESRCNGAKCTAACIGRGCQAKCNGQDCQQEMSSRETKDTDFWNEQDSAVWAGYHDNDERDPGSGHHQNDKEYDTNSDGNDDYNRPSSFNRDNRDKDGYFGNRPQIKKTNNDNSGKVIIDYAFSANMSDVFINFLKFQLAELKKANSQSGRRLRHFYNHK